VLQPARLVVAAVVLTLTLAVLSGCDDKETALPVAGFDSGYCITVHTWAVHEPKGARRQSEGLRHARRPEGQRNLTRSQVRTEGWFAWSPGSTKWGTTRAFLFEGVSWRNQCVRVVHGELSREQTRGDASWHAWKNGAGIAVREGRRDRRSESDPL
jgi:hypothetical protein